MGPGMWCPRAGRWVYIEAGKLPYLMLNYCLLFCRQTVSNLVTGVGRACFFRHGTRTAAEAAFNEALAAGAVEIL